MIDKDTYLLLFALKAGNMYPPLKKLKKNVEN